MTLGDLDEKVDDILRRFGRNKMNIMLVVHLQLMTLGYLNIKDGHGAALTVDKF